MIYLLLAIVSSAMISIVMRLSEERVSGRTGMLAVNYLVCLVLAGAYMGFGNVFPAGESLGGTLGMGAVNGFLYLMGFVLLQFNIRRNGVVLSSTFMKLGLLVPMAVSILFFGEMPDLLQILGFALAVAAILLINVGDGESSAGFKAGLILLLLAGGGGDAMAKFFEELGNTALSEQYLFYSFGAAFLFCLVLMLWKKERPGLTELLFGVLIAVPNYYSARFLLRSLENLAAVIVYPTYSVATILVVTLAGVCFFRERLEKRQWLAVAVILAALVLLNI